MEIHTGRPIASACIQYLRTKTETDAITKVCRINISLDILSESVIRNCYFAPSDFVWLSDCL